MATSNAVTASASGTSKAAGGSVSSTRAKVPLSIKIGYSFGIYGIGLVHTSFSVLLIFCYTDVFGIAPQDAGLIVFCGSAIDIICNLSVPWLTTQVRSRRGRYRPFLLYGGVFLGAAFAMMFAKPNLPVEQIFLYALVTHLLYRAAYAIVLTPHAALIGRISDDADERAAIGSVKAVGSNLGTLTAAYLGMGAVEWIGGSDPVRGFLWFGVIFGTLAGGAVVASGIFTREQASVGRDGTDTGNVLRALKAMFINDQLLLVLAATLIFFAGYTVLNGSIIYFFKYVRGDASEAKLAVLAIAVGGIIMPLFWNMMIERTGKMVIWLIGGAMVLAPLLLLLVTPDLPLAFVLLSYVIAGAGKSGVIMNYFAITADAVDYGHWRHGHRTEAYSFGMLAISNKVGTALGGATLGYLLAWSGFEPNVAQTPETVGDLRQIALLAPAILIAASCGVIAFFKVSAARHRSILLALREGAGTRSGS